MKITRRSFIKNTGTGLIASGIPAFANPLISPNKENSSDPFRLAIAGFSFSKFSLDQALVMMQRVAIKYLGVKNYHLPLESTQDVIDQTLAKMKSFGVEPYCVGPIYMTSEAAVDQAFAHAKMVGVNLLVGVPDVNLLPYVEKKVKEYNIRLAIHNHGPDQLKYQGPDDIWKEIKNLDPRIGFCLDIAHTARLGLDPVESYKRFRDRIYDMHIWDVDKPEKAGWCVEGGRGIIDFPNYFKTLRETKYSGTCSLEYGKDMEDPLPGIAESIGYFKGVMAGLKS